MEDKNKKKCDLCEEKASNICFECSFFLCDSCFNFLHTKKSKETHKKEGIEPYFSKKLKCPLHPKIPLNLFCTEEKGKSYLYNF